MRIEALLGALSHVGTQNMRFCALAGTEQRGCAVQLSADNARDGYPEGLKFNAFGSIWLIAACEWWCRRAAQRQAVSALECLEALALPRQQLAQLLVIEDAWQLLLKQCEATMSDGTPPRS